MTSIAGCVSVEACGDRQCNASTRGPVTSSAANTLHGHVARVIERHAEALKTRERLHGARLHICMADRADRAVGVGKLLRVTACARRVIGPSRKLRSRRVALATMTEKTGQARMVSAVVQKL